jgi:hypothetical protein
MPLSLTDHQLKCVMEIAANIDADRRSVYLQRLEAMLRMQHKFNDQTVKEISQLAATGLTVTR